MTDRKPLISSVRKELLTNAVKYVDNVSAHERRVQVAITAQARKMERQAECLLTRSLRRVGWR